MQKVKLAYLQTPTSLPGLLNTTTELSPRILSSLKMQLDDGGNLRLSATNQKGDIIMAFIPAANVKVALLEQSETVPKTSK